MKCESKATLPLSVFGSCKNSVIVVKTHGHGNHFKSSIIHVFIFIFQAFFISVDFLFNFVLFYLSDCLFNLMDFLLTFFTQPHLSILKSISCLISRYISIDIFNNLKSIDFSLHNKTIQFHVNKCPFFAFSVAFTTYKCVIIEPPVKWHYWQK